MRAVALAMSVAALLHSDPIAQNAGTAVGNWRLVSASATTADGGRNQAPFGSTPTGALTYTPDGRMIVIISYGGRTLLSGADRIASPVAERAEAFATSFAYAGGTLSLMTE